MDKDLIPITFDGFNQKVFDSQDFNEKAYQKEMNDMKFRMATLEMSMDDLEVSMNKMEISMNKMETEIKEMNRKLDGFIGSTN